MGAEVEVIFANHADAVLKYTDVVIACDIHTRNATKRLLLDKEQKLFNSCRSYECSNQWFGL